MFGNCGSNKLFSISCAAYCHGLIVGIGAGSYNWTVTNSTKFFIGDTPGGGGRGYVSIFVESDGAYCAIFFGVWFCDRVLIWHVGVIQDYFVLHRGLFELLQAVRSMKIVVWNHA